MTEKLRTLKIYYEFKNRKMLTTTIEFENLNLEDDTFKFTICSEYLENGKKKKIKYKEIRTGLKTIYDRFSRIDTSAMSHDILNHDTYYTVRLNDLKIKNHSDKFLEMLEAQTKLFIFKRLKINEYTKENIDACFDKL